MRRRPGLTNGGNGLRRAAGGTVAQCYADVPNRLVALLLDCIILSVLIFVVAAALSVVLGPAVDFTPEAGSLGDAVDLDRGLAVVDALASMGVVALYLIVSWSRLGGSPGSRALGIRIGDGAGGALTPARAVIRWTLFAAPFSAATVLATAVPVVNDALLDAVVIAWYLVLLGTTARSPTKQGLHDRLAGAVVVKAVTVLPPDDLGVPEGATVVH